MTFTPVDLNTSIASCTSATFGFCANAPTASDRPVVTAWNMESNAYASCPTNSGVLGQVLYVFQADNLDGVP